MQSVHRQSVIPTENQVHLFCDYPRSLDIPISYILASINLRPKAKMDSSTRWTISTVKFNIWISRPSVEIEKEPE